MTEEKIKEFSLRISQCSRTELVVITDEIVIDYLKDAKKAYQSESREPFLFVLKKARQFIDVLSSALDMRFEISYDLINLYNYVKRCIIQADARYTDEHLDEIISIMENLRDAFVQVAKNDHSGSVVTNSQKVYAGLTYGPGSKLNEVII